ncbi:DUF1542 domain-containing protein [Fructobacillus evanidus]|uniref:DUF1542 domain-containing protein n=1 Tax=Fructobacillus evanidus TaxID=3064281 RepID=A0ABN9YI14_9LACO|nr:unnamed protein product [Fructobacillus sp. LMG 32999]CAK1222497.1 unnamed protein product [Fructobacillus sp. LMG 32999]CAK1224186.1 unnamed protein product [Fructobacillus sp. LMG 32999]CAK1224310.1 unnamed protein product [Fructobacillus sp. LMG 32999]CAK1224463.1 unnamed protein product [Fructobacillus sp. LMG 32999]
MKNINTLTVPVANQAQPSQAEIQTANQQVDQAGEKKRVAIEAVSNADKRSYETAIARLQQALEQAHQAISQVKTLQSLDGDVKAALKTIETIAEPMVDPSVEPSVEPKTDEKKTMVPATPSVEPKADEKETTVPATPSVEPKADEKETTVPATPSVESKTDKRGAVVPTNQTKALHIDDKQVATSVKVSDSKLAQAVSRPAEIAQSNAGAQQLLTDLSEDNSATAKDSHIEQKQKTMIDQIDATIQHRQIDDTYTDQSDSISILPKTNHGHINHQRSVKSSILVAWLVVLTGLGLIKKKYDDIDF